MARRRIVEANIRTPTDGPEKQETSAQPELRRTEGSSRCSGLPRGGSFTPTLDGRKAFFTSCRYRAGTMSESFSRGKGRPSSRSAQPADVFPTFDEIARRAHELFAAAMPRDGVSIFECWRRAEDELLELAAARATRSGRE
jgi:hypothetical protein